MHCKTLSHIVCAFIAGAVAGGSVVYFSRPVAEKPGIERVVSDARSYNIFGLERMSERKFDEAEVAFRKALELSPNYDVALNNLANVTFAQKKYEETVRLIERLRELRVSGARVDLCKCYFSWADDLIKKNNFQEAEEKFDCFFALKPESETFCEGANLYIKLASSYFDRRDFWKCVNLSRRLLGLVPEHFKKERAKLNSNLSLAYLGLSESDPAYLAFVREHILKARELDPGNSQIESLYRKYEDKGIVGK